MSGLEINLRHVSYQSMMAILKNCKGSTVFSSLLVMLILAFIGINIMEISSKNLILSHNDGKVSQAFFYAEAGLAYAQARLLDDWHALDTFSRYQTPADIEESADGSPMFKLMVETLSDDHKKVSSVGTKNFARRSLSLTFERNFLFHKSFPDLEAMSDYAALGKVIDLTGENIEIHGQVKGETVFYDEGEDEKEQTGDEVLINGEANLFFAPYTGDGFDDAPVLANIAQKLESNGDFFVDVKTGNVNLTTIPYDPYVLIVLKEGKEGKVTINLNDLTMQEASRIIVLAEDLIEISGSFYHSLGSNDFILAYSESQSTGVKISGNDVSINGSFLSPHGRVNMGAVQNFNLFNNNDQSNVMEHVFRKEFFYHTRKEHR